MEQHARIQKIISLLKEATKTMQPPLSTLLVQEYGRDPFIILFSCLLSLRARDVVTYGVCKKLFARARNPHEILAIPLAELEELLYPLGFYRKKAQVLREVARTLIDTFSGKVPGTQEELLSLKGVGRKTANLVLGEAFLIPAICVDTHVHRVANRLGIIDTKTPEETEYELMRIIPKKDWIELNRYLVTWGQNICVPQSPWCSKCVLLPYCDQKGVIKMR
jgi:endonuclease III